MKIIMQRSPRNTINLFLTTISCFLIVTPYLNRNFSVSIWSGIIVLWYIDCFVRKGERHTLRINSFIFLLWFLWCFSLRIVGYSSAEWGNYFLLLCSIDVIIKALYIKENYSEREKNILLRCLQVCLLVTLLLNVFTWVNDSSEFDNFYFFAEKYQATNKIQSAQYYNMLAFLIGDSLFLFSRDKKTVYKLLDLCLVLFSSFFILFVNPRMNALLLAIIASVLIILFIKPGTEKKIIITGLVVVVLIVILALNKDALISMAGPRLKPRLESIFNLFSGKDFYVEGSSMARRFELQLVSLKTFVSSPLTILMGAGLHLGPEFYSIIGQHGFISDTLAEYGLIGVAFLLFFFMFLFKYYISVFKDKINKKAFKAVIITFFISSFICNPFCKEVCISAFLLPSLFYEITPDYSKKEVRSL